MFDSDRLTQLLNQVPQFRQIPEQDLREFILAGQIDSLPGETIVFGEDELCAGLYVLLRGQVRLCRHSLEGQVSILAIIDPVIMFNEVAALDGGPNPVSAITNQETTLWRIAPERLHTFLLGNPSVCLELLRILAGRNRRLVAQFQDLSFRTVQARAAKLLLELSANGTHPIDRRKSPSHQLAAQIATVPEAFSRALKTLRESGAIEVTPQFIRVRDPEHLGQLACLNPF
jgi:CRP/FNR family transcriptional regulator